MEGIHANNLEHLNFMLKLPGTVRSCVAGDTWSLDGTNTLFCDGGLPKAALSIFAYSSKHIYIAEEQLDVFLRRLAWITS